MNNPPQATERFLKLDGVRGLLSLIVALNHSCLVVAIPAYANVWGQNYFSFISLQAKLQQILMLLGNGGAAVSMFFVLSGFVLSQSFKKHTWSLSGYFSYLVKRIARLYPIYLFTISLIAIFTKLGFEYRRFPDASSWYHWWMNFPLDWPEFIRNVFFININLGGVTWTLRVIFIVSLFVPLLYLLTTRVSKFVNLTIAILLLFISFNMLNIEGFRDLRYVYMFYFGLITPFFAEQFKKVSEKMFLLSLPILLFFLFVIRYQTNEYIGGVYETITSWILLGLIIYQPKIRLFSFLENKLFIFLGRISYSLYLVHFSVLYCLARLMFQYLPGLNYSGNYLFTHTVLFVTSLLITIPLSVFMNKYIETPPVTYISALLKKNKA